MVSSTVPATFASRERQQTTRWYVNAYLHADDPNVLPLGEDVLNGLQFGGKRNYGYGMATLKDTQVVGLEALDYSRLEDGEAFILELVTSFVLRSEYPKANHVDVPWSWSVADDAQLTWLLMRPHNRKAKCCL